MAACWPRHGASTAARPMGGYIDKSYDRSGSDIRRASTNSRDPPRPAARAFTVLRSMTRSNLVACSTEDSPGANPRLLPDDVRIKDDAAGPDSNVLRLSGRRATDPRIPLQEVFSSQFFRAPLGRTSSRTALARRKSGPHETLAQLSQQPLQRVLEIQCVSRMSEMRCASWDDSLVQRLTRRLTLRRTRV